MFGTNNNDGMYMLHNAKRKLHLFRADYTRFIPPNQELPVFGPAAELVGELIKKFYFNDGNIDENSLEKLSDLMTDYYFLYSQVLCSELHAKHQHKSRTFETYLITFLTRLKILDQSNMFTSLDLMAN